MAGVLVDRRLSLPGLVRGEGGPAGLGARLQQAYDSGRLMLTPRSVDAHMNADLFYSTLTLSGGRAAPTGEHAVIYGTLAPAGLQLPATLPAGLGRLTLIVDASIIIADGPSGTITAEELSGTEAELALLYFVNTPSMPPRSYREADPGMIVMDIALGGAGPANVQTLSFVSGGDTALGGLYKLALLGIIRNRLEEGYGVLLPPADEVLTLTYGVGLDGAEDDFSLTLLWRYMRHVIAAGRPVGAAGWV